MKATNNFHKILNVAWKAGVACIGILIVVIAIALVVVRIDDEKYYYEKTVSDNVVMRNYCLSRNKRNEFYNIALDKVMYTGPGEVKSGHACGDSLAVYFDGDKRGYMNVNTGELVIEPIYRRAWYFSEGLGAVTDSQGRLGFVDKTGRLAIPMKFSYDIDDHNSPIFKSGLCIIRDHGMYGLIDKTGSWAIRPEYKSISYEHGYWLLKHSESGMKGVCDTLGNMVFPCEYDRIKTTIHGTFLLAQNGFMKEVEADGHVLNPFVADHISNMQFDFGLDDYTMEQEKYVGDESYTELRDEPCIKESFEGMVRLSETYAIYRVAMKCGVIRRADSKVIIPALYNDIEMISPTVFKAELFNMAGYVFLDLNGRQISNL